MQSNGAELDLGEQFDIVIPPTVCWAGCHDLDRWAAVVKETYQAGRQARPHWYFPSYVV
ncbi:MAG: hypothetical protein R3B47_07215 [Bacteroidia bacterium]